MLDANTIQIQSLKCNWWKNIRCDVLRLDQFHQVVSGNKWFKLSHYLADAAVNHKEMIATFGGAYSNHIVATAFACQQAGIKCTGFIRGEKPPQLSLTLQEAEGYGMKLIFVSREAYRDKATLMQRYHNNHWYWIAEGGYGQKGMEGAASILATADTGCYSHIICACGTGTTLAGLVKAARPQQTVIGISVLKGHNGLQHDVMQLLGETHLLAKFTLFHDYHFGGYAKHPPELIYWMNELWDKERLPTDIVYTAKLVYAVKDLVQQEYFSKENNILIIHSGGLQGNSSLPEGTLHFL